MLPRGLTIGIVLLALCLRPATSQAQATCLTAVVTTSQLSGLFTGVAGVGATFSRGSQACWYTYDKRAQAPSWYQGCVNWECQKKSERVGIGLVAALNAADGWSTPLLGSSDFGMSNTLTVRSVSPDRRTIRADQGLVFHLLGFQLRLPRQGFSVNAAFGPPDLPSPLFAQNARWQWDSTVVQASVPVPTGVGDMIVGLNVGVGAPTRNTATHTALYDEMRTKLGDHDWLWYRNYTNHWQDLVLRNQWGLTLESPPLGVSSGGIEASLRLVVNGAITGTLTHNDPAVVLSSSPAEAAGELRTYNKLETVGEISAHARATIKVWGIKYVRELELGEFTGEAKYTNASRVIARFAVKVTNLVACPASPAAPPMESWMTQVMASPPITRADDPPPDLSAFASGVTGKFRRNFQICDGSRPYDATRDPNVISIAASLQGKSLISPLEFNAACQKLRQYLDTKLRICELNCPGGVCPIRELKASRCERA